MIFFRRSHAYDPAWEVTPGVRWLIWTSGWRGALVLAVLIIIVVLSWNGAGIYERVKIWRAERLISQSESAREKGDFTEAALKLRQAAILLQYQPITLRAVARYQMEMRDLAVLDTYAKLVRNAAATEDDKITYARQAFRLGRPDLANRLLEELNELSGANQSAAILSLNAEQSAAQGRWPEALKLARQSCAVNPCSAEDLAYSQSVLARLLVHSPAPLLSDAQSLRGEGMNLLSSLAMRIDAIGLEALEALVSLSQNPQTAQIFQGRDVAKLINAALKHPRADAALKVGVWSLRLAAEPAKLNEISQALFESLNASQPVGSSSAMRLEAARWLNQKGMNRLALKLAEPSKWESKDWFVLYLDAMAAQGRWEDVLRALNTKDHDVPLASALRKLFEFRVASETGHRPNAVISWREIQNDTLKASTSEQLYVAGYAEQIGYPAEAARIYERLLSRDETILPARDRLSHPRRLACYTGLLRTGGGAMALKDLSKLVNAFATEFPEIDEVQNDSAYLQLLNGENYDRAASVALQLTQKKPEMLAYRTTLAFALLKQGKMTEAAAIYKGWTIDWSNTQDRYKAIYAAVMRAAGREYEARQVASKIKVESLRPEERKLAGMP